MCIESKTLPQRAIHRHIPQSCAERFFDAFFVVVSMKGGQSKLGRLEKLRIKNFCWSPHGRIKSRHVVTSDYCIAHFQKWKCSGLVSYNGVGGITFEGVYCVREGSDRGGGSYDRNFWFTKVGVAPYVPYV